MKYLVTLPCIVFLLSLAQTASAQGYRTAFACGNLAEELRVDVEVMDDTNPMVAVRDSLVAILRERGAVVSGDAPLLMTVDARLVRRPREERGPDLGSFGTKEGDVMFRMNIWSSREDSIVGGRKPGVLSDAVDQVRLSVSVNSKADGHCLWQGEAVYDFAGRDQWEIARKMVPYLAEVIGESARREPFEINE